MTNKTIKFVTKRDLTKENYDPSKILRWELWAAKGIEDKVDWQAGVMKVQKDLYDGISTEQINDLLIKHFLSIPSSNCDLVAGRLLSAQIRKKVFGDFIPTVKTQFEHMIDIGMMKPMTYTDEEYKEIETIIDHDRDFNLKASQVKQIYGKYSLSNRAKGIKYETPQFVSMRMAMALSEFEPDRVSMVKRFYDMFSLDKGSAPTPNQTNLGTFQNGYFSCVLYTVADDSDSLAIGDHIAYKMTLKSAGIGGHLNVRSIGDPVKNGAIVHKGKLYYYNAVAGAVHANRQGARGGACTQFFSVYDPEVMTIIHLQNPRTPVDQQNRDLDFAIQYNDFFISKFIHDQEIFLFNAFTAPDLQEAFFDSDSKRFAEIYAKYEADPNFKKTYHKARDLMIAALIQSHEVSTLYSANMTEINRHTPFKEPIHSSNLCVAPETLILTDKGHLEIGSLENQTVNVWNGSEWSETVIKKTGENQKLITVFTDSGPSLTCTPYHKFYVFDGYNKPYVEKRAYELLEGDKLCKFDLPVLEGTETLDKAYINGFYTGDGCLVSDDQQRVYLYGEKRALSNHFTEGGVWIVEPQYNRMFKHYKDLKPKFFVPDSDYTVKSRLDWFAGLLDADGCVYRNKGNQQLVVNSVDPDFLTRTLLMLQTLGISAKSKVNAEEALRKLPKNDKTKDKGDYWCKTSYRLLVNSVDVQKLMKLGLKTNRLVITEHTPDRSASQFVKVDSVNDLGRYDDTYCFTEPKRHMGVFNGILTGQCLEITQPTKPYMNMMDLYSEEHNDSKGEISMCALGAVIPSNITSDEEYEETCYLQLKMIDKCMELNDYAFPHLKTTVLSRRNAGVGVVGVAHLMAKKKLKFNTPEGYKFMHWLAERHSYFLIKASLRIAKERGVAPWIYKTKWPEGWTPISTYNRNVDSIADFELHYDWKTLTEEIVAFGGIAHSCLVAHMPTESSSKRSGMPNSFYPIRAKRLIKTDGTNSIEFLAPDIDELEDDYQIAFDLTVEEQYKFYAIWQKFADQAISLDIWSDRVKNEKLPASRLIEEFMCASIYGAKTRYYTTSKTTQGKTTASTMNEGGFMDRMKANTTKTVVQSASDEEDERGCAGGFCSV